MTLYISCKGYSQVYFWLLTWMQMSVNAISVCASIRYMKENIYIFMIFSDHWIFFLLYTGAFQEERFIWTRKVRFFLLAMCYINTYSFSFFFLVRLYLWKKDLVGACVWFRLLFLLLLGYLVFCIELLNLALDNGKFIGEICWLGYYFFLLESTYFVRIQTHIICFNNISRAVIFLNAFFFGKKYN